MEFKFASVEKNITFSEEGCVLSLISQSITQKCSLAVDAANVDFWELKKDLQYRKYLAATGIENNAENHQKLSEYFLIQLKALGAISRHSQIFDLESFELGNLLNEKTPFNELMI